MGPEPRSGHRALRDRPMVFVDDLDVPQLTDGDRNHLERALRLRSGDPIAVADGAGRWRPARFGTDIQPDGAVITEAEPAGHLTVGFAPVKGDRSDLIVQKLTELGVDRIVPLLTERTVVRWDEGRADKNLIRHRKIVRESAMQSRNLRPPTVGPLCALAEFLKAEEPGRVVLADPAGEPLVGPVSRIAIGPEGGFSPEELAGREIVGLPGRILRTETAAITAAVLAVNARRG
ncbi:MAG: RsmE family RNA methyltransferase [Actinomycetota bacterium]